MVIDRVLLIAVCLMGQRQKRKRVSCSISYETNRKIAAIFPLIVLECSMLLIAIRQVSAMVPSEFFFWLQAAHGGDESVPIDELSPGILAFLAGHHVSLPSPVAGSESAMRRVRGQCGLPALRGADVRRLQGILQGRPCPTHVRFGWGMREGNEVSAGRA